MNNNNCHYYYWCFDSVRVICLSHFLKKKFNQCLFDIFLFFLFFENKNLIFIQSKIFLRTKTNHNQGFCVNHFSFPVIIIRFKKGSIFLIKQNENVAAWSSKFFWHFHVARILNTSPPILSFKYGQKRIFLQHFFNASSSFKVLLHWSKRSKSPVSKFLHHLLHMV